MAAGLKKGYATAGTDTGHAGDNLDFALGHPEKVTDWSYRAIHLMTDLAKQVVKSSRGRLPERAYFEGCSTAGNRPSAKRNATRPTTTGSSPAIPVTTASGNPRVPMGLDGAARSGGQPILPASKLPLLTRAAVAACDARMAFRTD